MKKKKIYIVYFFNVPAGNLSLGSHSRKYAYHPLQDLMVYPGQNFVRARKPRFSLDPTHKKSVVGGKLTSRYIHHNWLGCFKSIVDGENNLWLYLTGIWIML